MYCRAYAINIYTYTYLSGTINPTMTATLTDAGWIVFADLLYSVVVKVYFCETDAGRILFIIRGLDSRCDAVFSCDNPCTTVSLVFSPTFREQIFF